MLAWRAEAYSGRILGSLTVPNRLLGPHGATSMVLKLRASRAYSSKAFDLARQLVPIVQGVGVGGGGELRARQAVRQEERELGFGLVRRELHLVADGGVAELGA
jgi:hypothetical protein